MAKSSWFLVAVFALACGGARPAPPPNLLLVSLDTLRADHLGAYGYPRPTSPFLDSLAARGVLFERAFVATHGTTPSHTTMLSGLYQEVHRVSFDVDPGEVPRAGVPSEVEMLPEILRRHGYVTLAATDGGNVSAKLGFGQGFDEYFDRGNGIRRVTQRALRLLDERGRGPAPIFLFVHTYEVHSPYHPPKSQHGRFGHLDSQFAPTSENLLAHTNNAARTLKRRDFEHLAARYDEEILHTDEVLSRFFATLAARGFLADCLIVVTADHGEEFGDHGGLLHRDLLYDELLHVPLVALGAGLPAGRRETALASEIDLAPTILAALGLPRPAAMSGRNLFDFSRPAGRRQSVVAQYGGRRYALRTPEWKLVESTSPPRVELYDLVRDPREHHDVASANPDLVATLRGELAAWRSRQRPLAAAPPAAVPLDAEELARLRALGYLASD